MGVFEFVCSSEVTAAHAVWSVVAELLLCLFQQQLAATYCSFVSTPRSRRRHGFDTFVIVSTSTILTARCDCC